MPGEMVLRNERLRKILDDAEILSARLSTIYPKVQQQITPLPKCWSKKDKYKYLRLTNSNLRVHYVGSGKTHRDAGCVRAAHSIPVTCGLYYFEIRVLDKGEYGYIGIGLCSREANLLGLPGWNRTSYGYHGDDGYKFFGTGTGIPYGPSFTTGDVVGCGVNYLDNCCFFTKNGHFLGVAFCDLPSRLFPTVGMQSKGAIIETNFGQDQFLFDTKSYTDGFKVRMRNIIENFPILEPYKLYNIVMDYLIHHGYSNTALSFGKITGLPIKEDIDSIKSRKAVMDLIREGKIEEGINLTNKLYPKLLDDRNDLLFRLMCSQFIELLKQYSTTIEDEIQFKHDLQSSNIHIDENFLQHSIDLPLKTIKCLHLGREIYKLNKKLELSDLHDFYTKKMDEAFSLIAYNNPYESEMKWLLDDVQREPICNELNSAILKYLNKSSMSVLDLAPIIAKELLKFLLDASNPFAVFVELEDFFHLDETLINS